MLIMGNIMSSTRLYCGLAGVVELCEVGLSGLSRVTRENWREELRQERGWRAREERRDMAREI